MKKIDAINNLIRIKKIRQKILEREMRGIKSKIDDSQQKIKSINNEAQNEHMNLNNVKQQLFEDLKDQKIHPADFHKDKSIASDNAKEKILTLLEDAQATSDTIPPMKKELQDTRERFMAVDNRTKSLQDISNTMKKKIEKEEELKLEDEVSDIFGCRKGEF